MKRALPFVIIAGVLSVTLFSVWYLKRSSTKTQRLISQDTSVPGNRAIKLGADPSHALGAKDAPVMLEEFGDFECHSCGLLHPILNKMKGEFGSSLVIVFREFPIVSKHAHALEAARTAEAAGLQGKFWEMHDLLYENQDTWDDAADVQPIFEEYATTIGLALDRFKQDVSGAMVNQRIALDRERGYSIGVNSTPTVFLNGREVLMESMSDEKLRELIHTQIPSARP
jgi:protein-disulfide isomerase